MTAASGTEVFHYDPASNLLGAAPSLSGMQAWKASGDRLLRFALQARPDRPMDFTYDGHGNRIARTVPLPPKPELTEAERRSQRGADNLLRVMEVLTGTPKYEEPIEEPEVTQYRYDGSHQLIMIEHADGARSEYEYDALGRRAAGGGWRVAKHHTQAGGARQTTLFMWDGDWMMQEARSGCTPHEDRAVTIGLAGGFNNYIYADNRTPYSMDPLGLEAITMGAMGGGAVAGPPGALAGAVLGGLVLVAVGVVAWMASSTTTDKAGNKVSPIADTMQPPGNCSPGEHRRLQDEVDQACKGEKRSCRANMDNATILMMRQRNVQCAMAID
ncbi:hypothetical protein [Burkholderia stabilis]|uniref:hypothetical protein n=1 Tax=Burkholderia stabilis TaxID=95485 RepID=UPI001F4B7500|nr:hypothetical protein [Burkholderia stabilis]